jgi:hypothetical protein
MAAQASGSMAKSFGRLAGTWSGTNGFRLMPTDNFDEAPAAAELTTAADGHDLLLTYTWAHPADGPQDGVLLVGSPESGQHGVTAAWGDSWHQKPVILTLTGTLADGGLELTADYGGGWQWVISLDGEHDDALVMTMQNVIPDEHATEEISAGPYVAMVATLRRVD